MLIFFRSPSSKDTLASTTDETRATFDITINRVLNPDSQQIAKTSIVEEKEPESGQSTINSLTGRKLSESRFVTRDPNLDKPYQGVSLPVEENNYTGNKQGKKFSSRWSSKKKRENAMDLEENCCHHDDMHKHADVFEHSDGSNMHAVFLHILSDLLGSILVVITASCYILMDNYGQDYGGMETKWLMYIDPVLSLLLVVLIVVPTFTLVREASMILLNNTPDQLSPLQFAKEMMSEIPEVGSVHDFYLWRLTANITVATVHVVMKQDPSTNLHPIETNLMELSRKVNQFFHERGVHTTTIQMEFMDDDDRSSPSSCILRCNCTQAVTGVSRKISVEAKSPYKI